MPMIEGTNMTISGYARLYEVHGDAVINHISNTNEWEKFLSILNLPRAQASQKDYATWKKSGPCFPGTRQALLREMMDWVTKSSESKMYVLSGLAGIGKSTVVYTLATRADEIGLLGASFFFSRDDDNRNNAKRFFSTIAYQLCAYNETFANAIVDALLTVRGSAATTQDPLEQLKVLILDPLQSVVQSRALPLLVIVDALDECNEEDEYAVIMGLTQLVRILPSFKVILTTRPQPFSNYLFGNHDGHKIFHLQDIEDKVVDSDIRLYLKYNLSPKQVEKRYPRRQWCASDDEIDSLVRAAGRLFIIASTALRYIFDKSVSNPAAQMQKLLRASAYNYMPFKELDHFYTIILQNVIPVNHDDEDIVNRYQSVVGTIIFVQRPLSISTLAHIINMDEKEILAVLDNLQSVILLGSDDVPRIYHQSFPNYLTDQKRCKDSWLRIDPRIHHMQIALHCFKIMDKHLKYNILKLGNPARFMRNEDGIKEEGINNEQLQEKIPQHLRYACVYWVNHLEAVAIEDGTLMNRLVRFADEHVLHWFEVLSLIGKLDSAHHTIGVVLNLLKSSSSDLRRLLSDALRFVSKFYEVIERSALHSYYSALSFTPTDSLLYRRYSKKEVHDVCDIEGGPQKWDALIANPSHGVLVNIIKFSTDNSLLVSCSEQLDCYNVQGKLKIWDAATGTPISTFPGHRFAVANDCSTVASFEDKTITFYNIKGRARGAMFTTSSKILKLALSASSRFAVSLADGTVWLRQWESTNAKLIDSFDGSEDGIYQLEFLPNDARLAYSSNDILKLRDGISGKFIGDLQCGSMHRFVYSGNGTRIASLSHDSNSSHLKLWKSGSGALIHAVVDAVGWRSMAISSNGSLLATADYFTQEVKLWSESRGSLTEIGVLEVDQPIWMAFSLDDVLAIASNRGIELYSVKTHSFIHTLPFNREPTTLAFSPGCTRLAVGSDDGRVYLWDLQSIDTLGPPSKEKASTTTALAISRDCSRLACGFNDGAVELYGTNPTKRRIGATFLSRFRNKGHTRMVKTLAFTPTGRLLASGSNDQTIKLWNGKDGLLQETLQTHTSNALHVVALSNDALIAAGHGGEVTLWNLATLSPIHTFGGCTPGTILSLSISDDSTLITVANDLRSVSLLDASNRTSIATFNIPSSIRTATFLPDKSQFVGQSNNGNLLSLNLSSKDIVKGPVLEHLVQLPNTPLWHGVPIWYCQDQISGLFPQNQKPVPVLWIPRDLHVTAWAQGSSMIALGSENRRVILLRLLTSHAG